MAQITTTGNIILPSDTANLGKKLRTRSRTESANTVHTQATYYDELPSYNIYTEVTLSTATSQVALAISRTNVGEAGRIFKIQSLELIPLTSSALSGVLTKASLHQNIGGAVASGGNAVTPLKLDFGESATLGAELTVLQASGTATITVASAPTTANTITSRMISSEELLATDKDFSNRAVEMLPQLQKEVVPITLRNNGDVLFLNFLSSSAQVAATFGIRVVLSID